MPPLISTNLCDNWPLIATGKVRDLYQLDESTLLFIATDRVSAFDVNLATGICDKGRILNLISAYWLALLPRLIPSLNTHFMTLSLPATMPAEFQHQFEDRCMQVRKLHMFPIESIVRGYLTGTAWKEYVSKSTVCGMKIREGMREGMRFDGGLIWTPSTKAPKGEKDVNIHPDEAARIIGKTFATRIKALSCELYTQAHKYFLSRNIILADTKFEFGILQHPSNPSINPSTEPIYLADEVLTPDSSRYWDRTDYTAIHSRENGSGSPVSLDKQYMRDWLAREGKAGVKDAVVPEEVVEFTRGRYVECFERLTGDKWDSGS